MDAILGVVHFAPSIGHQSADSDPARAKLHRLNFGPTVNQV